jgi:hypothetical protein
MRRTLGVYFGIVRVSIVHSTLLDKVVRLSLRPYLLL